MTKQEYEATIAELRERHEAFVRIIREQAGDERFTDAYSINRIIALCDAHAPEPPAFLRRQTTDYECAISMLAAQTVAKSKLLGENLVLKARIAELEARCAKYKADSTRLDKLQESFIKGEEFHIVMCEGKNEDEQCEHDTHPHFEAFDWSWRGEPVRASTLRGVIDKALTEGGEHET